MFLLAAVFGAYPFRAGWPVDYIWIAVFGGFHRILWTLGVSPAKTLREKLEYHANFSNLHMSYCRLYETQTESYAQLRCLDSENRNCLQVCWFILVAQTGQGGTISAFLSAEFWQPLSSLSFAVYLLHPLPILLYVAMTREIQQLDHFYLVRSVYELRKINFPSSLTSGACFLFRRSSSWVFGRYRT